MTATEEADRHTQLLRGALDMCLLALLAREAAHGYELVRRVEAAGFGPVSYGTVYPLLTRMRRLACRGDTPRPPQGRGSAQRCHGGETPEDLTVESIDRVLADVDRAWRKYGIADTDRAILAADLRLDLEATAADGATSA